MSSLDAVANNIPKRRPLARESNNGCRRASVRVEALVLNANHHQPTSFMRLLSEACLDEVCRDVLLKLDHVKAQALVDAIQLVRANILL
jgi:hypothetical protein